MIPCSRYMTDYGLLPMDGPTTKRADYIGVKILGPGLEWTTYLHYGMHAYAQALVECGYKVEEA